MQQKHRTTVVFKGISKNIVDILLKHNVSLTNVISQLLVEANKSNRLLDLAKMDLDLEAYKKFKDEVERLKDEIEQNYKKDQLL